MTTNPLYALRSVGDNAYQMAKFDSDFNVEATYNLIAKGSDFSCDCPANNRSVVLTRCKHRRMMPLMLGAVNTDRFFDPITGQWHQPLAKDLAELIANEQGEVVGEAVPIPEPLTAEEIEELPDDLEKDFQHAMQEPPTDLPAVAVALPIPPVPQAPQVTRRR